MLPLQHINVAPVTQAQFNLKGGEVPCSALRAELSKQEGFTNLLMSALLRLWDFCAGPVDLELGVQGGSRGALAGDLALGLRAPRPKSRCLQTGTIPDSLS